MTSPIVFWDLDETLMYRRDAEITVTPGIEQLLEKFKNTGWKQYVATSGNTELAKKDLERAGLTSYFDDIFGQKQVAFPGKYYKHVLETQGIDYDPRSMIIIGNAIGDKPQDIDCLFLHLEGGNSFPVEYTNAIIQTLLDLGKGDFIKGFEEMNKGKDPDGFYHFKEFKAQLSYRDNDLNLKVPCIYVNPGFFQTQGNP